MKDFIVLAIIIAIAVFAGIYIYKQKKKGRKCIGCPYCDECKSHSCQKQ